MPLLVLDKIEVKYLGVILVLRGVSLEVDKGAIVTLLGSNGAGKTTTLKAISGLLKTEDGRVCEGTIEFDGHRIENGDPEKIARMGVIQVLEGRRVFADLTVEENLRAGAHVLGSRSGGTRDLDMVYGYFPVLKDLRNRASGYLSGGEQQMLMLGRALMAHPRLMLIDEASLGLAPLLVAEILRILKRINEEEKLSILLVEQNARAALSVAQYGYVIENGSIVHRDTADRLRQDANVQHFYLGLGKTGEAKSYRGLKFYKQKKTWLDEPTSGSAATTEC
jgi:branched-chain amino acid transport system ATP-binding protein